MIYETRPRNRFTQDERWTHLRFVRLYAVDGHPSQPVLVQLVTWNGSEDVPYGNPFRVGDLTTPEAVESGQNFWISWRRDARRWYPISGSPGSDLPTIFVRNLTGQVKPLGTIYGIGPVFAQSFADFAPQPTFDSKPPVAGQPFCIALEPALPGSIVKCVRIGGCWTMVYLNDTAHKFADCAGNNYDLLNSGSSGRAEIDWRERQHISGAGTLGLQRAWVTLDRGGGGTPTQMARVYAQITAATGPLKAQWGSGLVLLQDANTGALAGTPTLVDNDNIGTNWPVDSQVRLDMNHSPPRPITGTCNALSTSQWQGAS